MFQRCFLALLAGLLLVTAATAQVSLRFRFQQGQVLTYRVEQSTSDIEIVGDTKVETSTKMNNTKRWEVKAVDADGVATLHLSLVSLRIETVTPKGDVLLYDSENLDKSHPQMREQLGKYLKERLAIVRVNPQGKVVEVKESKFGPASRFESELPFIVALPAAALPKGTNTWERAYAITVEPPFGTGEKFDAVQQYECTPAMDGTATIKVATTLKTQPEALPDRVPLLRMQPEGEVTFDVAAGRLRSARLRIEKEIQDHQGAGSSYKFRSVETVEYVR